ncbi:hypothetical protein BpHYR1_030514 [Brachionus plicatilis]|uniref:Uncharacterized protein n=1 Tax=Brachionus plicatilis TaxID=10195 RepID=A0A3M7QYT9_BRAPC|nr:hypothetical protein BpHYR1_030514 [Brachionus plicatilis]
MLVSIGSDDFSKVSRSSGSVISYRNNFVSEIIFSAVLIEKTYITVVKQKLVDINFIQPWKIYE